MPKQAMDPPFPVIDVPVTHLDLDLRNSRFPRDAQSQLDALELMVSTAGDHCLTLAQDLMGSGKLNGSDLPIVLKHGERYTVVEGNRRLATIRLWTDADYYRRSASRIAGFADRIGQLADESAYAPPTALRVALAPNESAADKWIEAKHTGNARGAGVVAWGAAMKDRRAARKDPSKMSKALAFIELVSAAYTSDLAFMIDLEEVREKRYSFIQRFIGKSVVLDRIGLRFERGRMEFVYGAEASRKIIHRAFSDFARPKAASGKTWARELDTVEDFDRYLDLHAALLPGQAERVVHASGNSGELAKPSTKEAEASAARTLVTEGAGSGRHGSNAATSSGESMSGVRNALVTPARPLPPRPDSIDPWILRDLSVSNFPPRIQAIFAQTSRLNVNNNNEVAGVMLRVCIELATSWFLRIKGVDQPRALDDAVKKAILVLEPRASNDLKLAENTSQLTKIFHQTTSNQMRLMQYAVHDLTSALTPSETFALARRYGPFIDAMNDHLGVVD